MYKRTAKGYSIMIVVPYVLAIAVTVVFLLMYRQENQIKTQGIPVRCEIMSVTQEWEADDDLPDGGRYQDITNVRYYIDGIEYTDALRADLGEPGEEIELVYLPSDPKKVYSPETMESGAELMKYIAIGWCAFWMVLTILLAVVIIRGKRRRNRETAPPVSCG